MTDKVEDKNIVVGQVQNPPATFVPAEVTAPIIVALGKKKKKAIKRLKRGKGSTMDEVMDVIDQVQASLGEQAAGKILVPVVIVYKEKQRRLRGLF